MFPFTIAARDRREATRDGAPGNAMPLDGAPALREAVERVLARLVKGLQALAGAGSAIEGAASRFATGRVAAVIASHSSEGAAALLECPTLDHPMVATLDATLIHGLVELLCGGEGAEPPVAGRPATAIDRQFAQILFGLLASAIQTEWASFGFGTPKVARVEAGLAADVFGPRPSDIGVVDLTLGVFGLRGTLRLALPPDALARFRDAGQEDALPVVASDPLWSNRLREQVGQAPVELAAYLEAKPLTLSALSELRVGQILAMPADARTRAALVGDGRPLYRGEVGQADGRYSLRIDEVAPRPPGAQGRPSRTPERPSQTGGSPAAATLPGAGPLQHHSEA